MRLKTIIIPVLASVLFAPLAGASSTSRAAAAPQVRVIETSVCTIRLAEQTGDLEGLDWKNPHVEIIREPRLGENFRLLLPRPGAEASSFISREQKDVRIIETTDGVTCVYEKLRNARETLDIGVRYHIGVVEGRIEFSIEVDNPTDRPLAEVYFGIVG